MQVAALSSALGVAASAAWGAGDFSGGLAARRANVFGVVALGYSVGVLFMLIMVIALREPAPSLSSFGWAALAGVIGGMALAAFYAALASGKMGIVAPVSAVLTAAIPVIYAAFSQGFPRRIQIVGFLLALVALWLVSRPQEAGPPEGLGLAVISGVGFGLYLILISRAGQHAWFWPLLSSRVASVIAVVGVSSLVRKFRAPARPTAPLCALAGFLDAAGLACFLRAAQTGRLDTASVLASLYPAVTALLAWIVLKEHLSTLQRWGMFAGLGSVILIAAPPPL